MAVKYHSEFKSQRGVLYRIEIDDDTFSGASTEFNVDGQGFQLDYSAQNSDKYNPIVGSRLAFVMKVVNSTLETFITDLVTAAEGRYTVKVLRAGVFYWAGYILPDISIIQDRAKPYDFKVAAVDGLSRLKKIKYESSGSPIGTATFVTHILNCLTKDGLAAKYWATGDIFLRTAANWWHTTHSTPTTAKDPLALTRFNSAALGEQKTDSSWKNPTCFEVLEAIARNWGARLYFSAGAYRFEQVNYRNNNTFNERRYGRTGTAISQASINYDRSLPQTTTGARLDGASYEFFPALKEVRVVYEHETAKNHLEAYQWKWGSSASGGNQVLTGITLGSNAFFKISGQINLNLAGASTTPFHYRIRMTLKVGSNYLRRNVSFPSGQNVLNYENPTWQATGDTTISSGLIYQSSFSGVIDFSIWTPTLTASDTVEINFEVINAQTVAGSTVTFTTNQWKVENLILQVANSNDDTNKESERTYQLVNLTTGNSEEIEIVAKFGDALKSWTVGKLEVSANGSTWSDALVGWAFDGAGSYAFGDVLCRELMAGRKAPVRRMLGAIRGNDFYFHNLVSDLSSFKWLFLGGTFTAKHDDWSGEWFGTYYGTVTNDPQIIIDFERTLPGSKNETVIPGKVVTDDPVRAVFDIIKSSKVSSTVAAGSVTSVPVAAALQAGVFVAGQKIKIVNPLTGQSEQLTVSTTNAAGATSIAVTGTLSAAYPADSYIVSDNNANNLSGGSGAIPAGNIYNTDGTLTAARTVTQGGSTMTWKSDGSATFGQTMHILRGNVESTGVASTSTVFWTMQSKTGATIGQFSADNFGGSTKTVSLYAFLNFVLQLYGDGGVKVLAGATYTFIFTTDGTLTLPQVTADPSVPNYGALWYRHNLSKTPLKFRRGDNVEEVMTTPTDTRGDLDSGTVLTISSSTYTAGGHFFTVILNANSNSVTVTLGASLREGYDYWFDCDSNATNNIVFNADTANGFVLKVAGNTTLTPTSFTAASGGGYLVRRVAGLVFIK